MAVQYRSKKYLDEIMETSIGTDDQFCEENLREVYKASQTMFNDLCKAYGAEDPKKLLPELLNKNSIVKAQMAEWLFSAIFLLDHCCLPLMSSAKCQIEKLQEEKICDQQEVIDLQKELISKKSEQLSLVNKTVEMEIKSFSSVLQQSCSTALSPKNIATAVKKISKEEDRTKEIVVFGVDEEQSESPTSTP